MDILTPEEAIQMGYDAEILRAVSLGSLKATVTFREFILKGIDFKIVRDDKKRYAIRRRGRDIVKL